MTDQLNVFGEPLQDCSQRPLTGFYRTGCCETGPEDLGIHVVCAQMTAAFLAFSKTVGNDLTTPHPEFSFPGLKAGDRWCMVADRWVEALAAGMAPRVYLRATHQGALRHVELVTLKKFAADLD
jgi:uncharacterized protein (DUF2237 family)